MQSSVVKYFLGTFDGLAINDRFEISADEYESHQKILNEFSELRANENLFKTVYLNFEDFKNKTAEYLSKVPRINQDDIEKSYIDMNRLALNLLSSIRTFLDHKETYLKRKFGHESKELLFFEQIKCHAFDNSFEYRFISKLRNYSQHCGLPITYPEIKSFEGLNSTTKHEFNLLFDRTTLVDNFNWGKKVKADLEVQNDRFDVLPIFEKIYFLLDNINERTNKLVLENYKNDGQLLLQLIIKTNEIEGSPCLIKCVGQDLLTHTFSRLPLDHISKATGIAINLKTF